MPNFDPDKIAEFIASVRHVRNGKDGRDGRDGRDGIDGIPGLPGKDGAPGERGPKGDYGGPVGPQGERGMDGARGLLGHGADEQPVPQNPVYLVLSEAERAKGFVRPYRDTYVHVGGCGAVTTMGRALSETYARDPRFYGATYCVGCSKHRPVAEFVWAGTADRLGA
jgi:hypothetical protein